MKIPDRVVARLTGHSAPIHALTYSCGTESYILTGSSDRTINLYNPSKATDSTPSSAALIQSYTGAHAYEVLSLAVASDNSRFLSAGGDKSVFVWDVASAKTIRRFGGTGSNSAAAASSGTPPAGGHTARVESVAFGAEDSLAVSGSRDASVRVWDLRSSGNTRPVAVFTDAKDGVTCVAAPAGGVEVVAGSVDGRLRRWDVRMGRVAVDVVGEPITSIATNIGNDSTLVASLDSTLRLLDKSTGKLLGQYSDPSYQHETYRLRSTLAENDAYVVAGSEDGNIYVWDLESGECVRRLAHWGGDAADKGGARKSTKVVSAVAAKRRGGEWASAGGDGKWQLLGWL